MLIWLLVDLVLMSMNRSLFFILASALIAFSLFSLMYLYPFGERSIVEERISAVDFIFIDIDGVESRLFDFKGKVVLIDFMATWCYACKAQNEILRDLWSKYEGKNVVFLTISIDPKEDLDLLANYASSNGLNWIVGLSSEAGLKYKVKAIPTIVIVDRDGKIAFQHVGVVSSDELTEILDREIEG